MDPYKVTREFESHLCDYAGSKYAVAVNSCSVAIQLALMWWKHKYKTGESEVEVPRKTYISVPCAVKLAGLRIKWRDERWRGAYQLFPTTVIDSARRFTSGMYKSGQFQCVSFSTTKILGAEQGGAILHDDSDADAWLRRMRFDGRTEGIDPHEDTFKEIGLHAIMLPSTAAELTLKLFHLDRHNDDQPFHSYPDLSKHEAFR